MGVDVRLPQHGRDHRLVVSDGVVIDAGSDPVEGLAAILNQSVGGGAFRFIREVIMDEDGEILLDDIPQTFRHLRLYAKLRGTSFVGTALIGLNGISSDSLHNSFFVLVAGAGGGGFVPLTDWLKDIGDGFFGSNTFYISCDDANPDPDGWSTLILDLPYYREPVYKNCVGELLGNTQDEDPYFTSTELKGIWQNTDAITSITIQGGFGDLKAGCKASLYGIDGTGFVETDDILDGGGP